MWDQGPAAARGAAGRSSWRKEIRIRFGIRIGIHSSGRQANRAGFGIRDSSRQINAHNDRRETHSSDAAPQQSHPIPQAWFAHATGLCHSGVTGP